MRFPKPGSGSPTLPKMDSGVSDTTIESSELNTTAEDESLLVKITDLSDGKRILSLSGRGYASMNLNLTEHELELTHAQTHTWLYKGTVPVIKVPLNHVKMVEMDDAKPKYKGRRFVIRGSLRKEDDSILDQADVRVVCPNAEVTQDWLESVQHAVQVAQLDFQEVEREVYGALRAYIKSGSSVYEGGADLKFRERSGTSTSIDADRPRALPPITVPVPKMAIVMLVVGTHGDVQPFAALGKKLQAYGHRVRLATHAMYRGLVQSSGLEFYPLGGDPKLLSSFMVKTRGRLLPDLLNHEERHELPVKMNQVNNIITTCWPACTQPDPEDPEHRPFIAEAIISNPVGYAHVHCAEALGVQLHMMFPQPWVPTKSFPHPFASLPQVGPSSTNWASYFMVDEFFWAGTKLTINDERMRKMGMMPVQTGEFGAFMVNDNFVPFTFMWSPSLCPKPTDWGENISVAGNFFAEPESQLKDYKPPADLEKWLNSGDPPIFVGFGSMVIDDTSALVKCFSEAAATCNCRVLVQSSWSELTSEDLPPTMYQLGPAPHDWLLPRMSAVVHHGGAGTTAAGLKYGKPTFIVPFFGDQFFWGKVVSDSGCGPKPIPVEKLTSQNVAAAFRELLTEECRSAAAAMGEAFSSEDGVGEGVASFHRNLPTEDMSCQVSVFSGNPAVAHLYCPTCDLVMSVEAANATHGNGGPGAKHKILPYRYKNLGPRGPLSAGEGAMAGGLVLATEVFGGIADIVLDPVRGAIEDGVVGGVVGVGKGLVHAVVRPLRGIVAFGDKIVAGAHNEKMLKKEGQSAQSLGHTKRYAAIDHIVDKMNEWRSEIWSGTSELLHVDHEMPVKRGTVLMARRRAAAPLTKAREKELILSHERAMSAQKRFKALCGGSKHLTKQQVLDAVLADGAERGLSTGIMKDAIEELDPHPDRPLTAAISFTRFCVSVALVEGITRVKEGQGLEEEKDMGDGFMRPALNREPSILMGIVDADLDADTRKQKGEKGHKHRTQARNLDGRRKD
ncbi:unnamed protein product [Chrysoparadoxa australica]